MTPKQKAWLKSAEVAVVTGAVTAALQEISAGNFPSTKAGWGKFTVIVVGSIYTALKLYLADCPYPTA